MRNAKCCKDKRSAAIRAATVRERPAFVGMANAFVRERSLTVAALIGPTERAHGTRARFDV